ncbi:engulfment and cell motility protein 1-like [Diorhabda carinulata]|uniref:engulfment and cell motility protein 1-like n=1 Tax=Diorhabda carinulata TaxID=1163345 RepID=UPI0025A1F107|nr:engulfment and cell motility protein 1-like [Diorhabda carinulata]
MANVSNIAKISVEKHDSKEQILYDLDKNKSLCDIVKDICKTCGLPISAVYGLKLIQTNVNDPTIDTYLSEKTYKNIKHNDCIKIVFSIDYLLKNRIIPHINDQPPSLERAICYEDLMKLAHDPVFIEELVDNENHSILIKTYVEEEHLEEKELLALLITICHLFLKGYYKDIPEELLEKTINIVRNGSNDLVSDHIQYALAILHKILMIKDPEFIAWKERIIKDIPITCLIPYIRLTDCKNKLQYGVLLLINTIIRLCKGDQKKQLIKEMNLNQNREDIYKYIIAPGGLDKSMEHELYVIQTYILSLYEEALKSEVSLNDSSVFNKDEFELPVDDVRRLTVLLDFDEVRQTSLSNSLENLLTFQKAERFSLASIVSDKSQDSMKSSTICTPKLRQSSFSFDYENFTINYLTLEALRHYKNNHKKNFCQSQIEERVYEPGIFVTSEKVVKLLAHLLDIGLDPPDSKSLFYQPIVFNTSPKNPFFFELFSRSMWLLSRTRREMKVSTIEDYPKLMRALKKQIKMVLDKRPLNFKNLTNYMTELNYGEVLKQWQKEKDTELSNLLKNHPCIRQIKDNYMKNNEPYLHQNRLNVLKTGDYFPKVLDKKTSGLMFVQLNRNERELQIYDVTDKKTNEMELKEIIKTADITHIAVGLNCKHANLCKSSALAFSIIINYSEHQVNFIAENENMAARWTDGFNILTGNSRRSDQYNKELEILTEMDLKLQLIELQHVSIPKNPPPVPDVPKPLLPPKPTSINSRNKTATRPAPDIPK